MGVKVTGIDDVIRELEEEVRRRMEEAADELSGIGERVVDGILSGEISNWNDQTGNLRSSIGYVVTLDGKIREEGGFRKFGNATTGQPLGKEFARSLISQYPAGAALIIVAGMEYASYVEAVDNKTVLAQGGIEAERLIREMVEKLNRLYSK